MMWLSLLIVCGTLSFCTADYWNERAEFIKMEESQMLGSSLVLDDAEIQANEAIMNFKLKEYDEGIENPRKFLPSRHFFEVRSEIQKSEIYKIIKMMPKGAALHSHDLALVSQEYLYELTLRSNLYGCTINQRLNLRFLNNPEDDATCDWVLLETLRNQNSSYDNWVRSQLTLNVKNPNSAYSNINVVWKTMRDILATVTPLITYKPVFDDYLYQSLQELYDDNVFYLEFRGDLPSFYDLNGRIYGQVEVMQIYQDIIAKFKRDHSDFVGARFIYAPLRHSGIIDIKKEVKLVNELKQKFPYLLAGFDLCGQEDLGVPLINVISYLQEIPRNVDFYFHSGESNWYGATDTNMVDAILLGTKRIGHGFGLTKHPELMKIVKENNITVEVNPISNQVLMLVGDLRNHPASILISQGFPVVISYDDPSFWSVDGLSYDFYMAFMGIASRNADLKLLKQLVINSIEYSSLPGDEKNEAMLLWKVKWNEFIDFVNNKYPKNQETF